MKKEKSLFIFILFLYIILPIIICTSATLFRYKFLILTIIGVVVYIIFRTMSVSNEDLGITKKGVFNSIKNNMPIIIIAVLLAILIYVIGFTRFYPTETIWFYLFYIFVSCPFQEFLYRGVFGYFDKVLIKNSFLTTLLSSFCFSFVHIIYKDALTLLLTFIMGLIWYNIYNKDKNLLGVSLSHIIIGILSIMLGIVD